jgi:AGZA family xanthine/uracil permease-like MFS transporter
LWIALVTFLYVDLLDTTGTLFAMAKYANILDADGDFEGSTRAFVVDGFMTSMGALMGTSPLTTYIESATGIEAGGKTGLTAITVGFFFFLSIFFSPILASVPPWATGPSLICVGAMMMKGVVEIDWNDYGQAIPAWMCMIVMPLTYSIAYGIIAGLATYMVINGAGYLADRACGKVKNSVSPDATPDGSIKPVVKA